MKSDTTMLPPILVPPDIREAVDAATKKTGVSQAEAVRQSLRLGVGRYVALMALEQQRTPSRIREVLTQFPPLTATTGWKQTVKKLVRRKYDAPR
jgi:hypothetical protein